MPSPALLAAQAALLERRVNDGIKPAHAVKRPFVGNVGGIDAAHSFPLANAQATIKDYQRRDGVTLTRPATAVSSHDIVQTAVSTLSPIIPAASIDPASAARPTASDVLTRLHPTLHGQLQKDGHETIALYWLITKHIDAARNGKSDGWVTENEFKNFVTTHGLLNRRSANAIIRKMDGVLVDRSNGRLYHYSPEKVAGLHGYDRLAGSPVDISISRLTSGVKMFRATIHEAFLMGRPSGSRYGQISRETIQDITGASPESQRTYEAITGIIATPSYAFLEYSDIQEAAWEAGQAWFIFIDYYNIQGGGKGKVYLCRTLPNTYEDNKKSTLKRASKNSTKRINAAVSRHDSEASGNGQKRKRRVYYNDVTKAGKAKGMRYIPSVRRATAKARKYSYTFWQQQLEET